MPKHTAIHVIKENTNTHTFFSEALYLLVRSVGLLVDEAVAEKKELSKEDIALSLTLAFVCNEGSVLSTVEEKSFVNYFNLCNRIY